MTIPTPAELRELADQVSGHAITTSEKADILVALRACADVIERLRDIRDDCLDTACVVGDLHGNLAERYERFAAYLTALLPDNEEPK